MPNVVSFILSFSNKENVSVLLSLNYVTFSQQPCF